MNRSQNNFCYLGTAVMVQRKIRAIVGFCGLCVFEDSTYGKKKIMLLIFNQAQVLSSVRSGTDILL